MSHIFGVDAEERKQFLLNRARFSPTELAAYAGQWIAWCPHGSRIVAAAREPEAQDVRIIEAGEHPERCVIEGVPNEDAVIGEWCCGQAQLSGDKRHVIITPNASFPGRHLVYAPTPP
jgi:hypothetical protein